jgi:hypothetical protein
MKNLNILMMPKREKKLRGGGKKKIELIDGMNPTWMQFLNKEV